MSKTLNRLVFAVGMMAAPLVMGGCAEDKPAAPTPAPDATKPADAPAAPDATKPADAPATTPPADAPKAP